MRGFLLGLLGLALLEAFYANPHGPDAVGTGASLVAKSLNHLIDPTVPLIPDLRTRSK